MRYFRQGIYADPTQAIRVAKPTLRERTGLAAEVAAGNKILLVFIFCGMMASGFCLGVILSQSVSLFAIWAPLFAVVLATLIPTIFFGKSAGAFRAAVLVFVSGFLVGISVLYLASSTYGPQTISEHTFTPERNFVSVDDDITLSNILYGGYISPGEWKTIQDSDDCDIFIVGANGGERRFLDVGQRKEILFTHGDRVEQLGHCVKWEMGKP